MKLRRQLALVSLIALVLPWALGQYLQVFDRLLREGQVRAFYATAEAVAARLGADTPLLNQARLSNRASLEAKHEIYAHPLPTAPRLDGYADDWQRYKLTPRQLVGHSLRQHHDQPHALQLDLSAGIHQQSLFLLAQVNSHKVHYHRPGSDHLALGDHLIFANQEAGMGSRYYVIRTAAAGQIHALYRDAHGDVRPEYRIRGVWRERNNGYQVELQIPLSMAEPHFAVSAVAKNTTQPSASAGTVGQWAELAGGPDTGVLPGTEGRLIYPSSALSEALKIFSRPGMRLQVTDRQGWQMAQAGQLTPLTQQRHWALQWLLDFAGQRHSFTPWQANLSGRQQSPPSTPLATAIMGTSGIAAGPTT